MKLNFVSPYHKLFYKNNNLKQKKIILMTQDRRKITLKVIH